MLSSREDPGQKNEAEAVLQLQPGCSNYRNCVFCLSWICARDDNGGALCNPERTDTVLVSP